MKKLTGVILAFALFLPSTGCGWGPWDYAGPLAGYGYRGPGYGYRRPYPYRNYDYDRYDDSDNNSDADAAVLGAVLGTAAVIGTVIAIDAIRNQPPPESTPPPPPRFNP